MRVAVSSGGWSGAMPVAESELDVGAVSRALWRRKWWILLPALAVAAATFVVVNMLTPRYDSEARVLIDTQQNIFLRPDAEKSLPERATLDDQAIASEVQVFLSRDIADAVIRKLQLAQRPEFDPLLHGVSLTTSVLASLGLIKDPRKMTPMERVLQIYYERLNVYAVARSRVIGINFESADPRLAAQVANAIAEQYLALQRQAKQEQARSASKWLAGEIAKLQKKVSEAEAKVAAYRAKSSLFVGTNNALLSNQQLSDLNTQLANARAQRADAEARANLIRNLLKSGKPIEATDVIDSALVRRLAEQRGTLRAQLAEQSSTLLPEHPRIKELKAQIADLNMQIREEARRRVHALENNAQIAGARVQSLLSEFDRLKHQAASSNELDVRLRTLERDAKSERNLLESYLAKYREAVARESISAAPADAQIISRATVSNIPVYPKRIPMVLVATVLTLMLGLGFTATRELLRPQNVRPLGPVEPVLTGFARAPERLAYRPSGSAAPAGGGQPALPVPLDVVEDLARDLREAGEAGARVTVFGAARNVGTSLTAITLARSLDRDARVVLIDLALKAPNLSAISTDPKAPGIAELVAGKATVGQVITKDQLSSVHLIGAGRRIRNPARIVDSPQLAVTLEALAQTYDHVIIDAGVVGAMSAERFAELAPTGVLVVTDADDQAAAAAREQLQAAGFADVALVVATG